MTDRQRSESLRVHLVQPARLEPRGHQRETAAGKNPPRLAGVEADGYPNRVRSAAAGIDQGLLGFGLAASGDDNLSAGFDDLVGGRQYEIDAFLMNQARDKAEDRTAGHGQSKLLADVICVGLLAVRVAGAKRLRQLRAESRIPAYK